MTREFPTIVSRIGIVALLAWTMPPLPSHAARKHSESRTRAETRRTISRPDDRGQPPVAVTPSTDPAALWSPQEWSHYVRTALPRFSKVNPGPFAVWQNRRFERGETRVPASTNTF